MNMTEWHQRRVTCQQLIGDIKHEHEKLWVFFSCVVLGFFRAENSCKTLQSQQVPLSFAEGINLRRASACKNTNDCLFQTFSNTEASPDQYSCSLHVHEVHVPLESKYISEFSNNFTKIFSGLQIASIN